MDAFAPPLTLIGFGRHIYSYNCLQILS